MHKKFIKFFSVLFVCVIILSMFSITAFAEELSPSITFGGLNVESINIRYTLLDGTDRVEYAVIPQYFGKENIGGKQVDTFRVYMADGTAFVANYYKVTIEIKTQDFAQKAPYFFGSYSVGIPKAQGYMEKTKWNEPLPEPICFRFSGGPTEYAKYQYFHTDYMEYLKLTYGRNEFGTSYVLYNTTFWFSSSGANYFDFYLFDNTMKTYSESEISSQQIIENDNENTDKILNGDSDLDSSGETDKIDGTFGDIDNATSDALGGKSDEEIQAEINESLDPDKIGLDFNKASRISAFFDNCLDAFGSSYKSLLLLSLSLGLGAFLIGRRYG